MSFKAPPLAHTRAARGRGGASALCKDGTYPYTAHHQPCLRAAEV